MNMLLVVLATALMSQAPAAEAPTGVAKLNLDAAAMAPLVTSPLAREFLAGIEHLPPVPAPRVVYYNKKTRDAFTESAAAGMDTTALGGYERTDISEEFFYSTRYGSPVAFVRPLEIIGQAGVTSAGGLKLADFGFGSIGQLRALASRGAHATGIEVDALLRAIYSAPGDTGPIARAGTAATGAPGSVTLVFGKFPADPAVVTQAGTGYDVFISKNTLKRGYVHPEQEVDPRMLVHLEVSDETYVRAVFDLLKPGGLALIYNLSPPPSKEGEPYKPWADGRSPFDRAVYETVGFEVIAFDQNDDAAARAMGQALGWGESMNLETDLFGMYTLVRRPK